MSIDIDKKCRQSSMDDCRGILPFSEPNLRNYPSSHFDKYRHIEVTSIEVDRQYLFENFKPIYIPLLQAMAQS